MKKLQLVHCDECYYRRYGYISDDLQSVTCSRCGCVQTSEIRQRLSDGHLKSEISLFTESELFLLYGYSIGDFQ